MDPDDPLELVDRLFGPDLAGGRGFWDVAGDDSSWIPGPDDVDDS